MDRFTDDLHLIPVDQYQPTVVVELLRRQNLEDAPRTEQARAIRDWLKSHTPTPLMEHSIRMDGFGDLLDRRATA